MCVHILWERILLLYWIVHTIPIYYLVFDDFATLDYMFVFNISFCIVIFLQLYRSHRVVIKYVRVFADKYYSKNTVTYPNYDF